MDNSYKLHREEYSLPLWEITSFNKEKNNDIASNNARQNEVDLPSHQSMVPALPMDPVVIILTNMDFRDYKNASLVCKLWNECSKKTLNTNMSALSTCKEILINHPYKKWVILYHFGDIVKDFFIKQAISWGVGKINRALGYSWNYTTEQVAEYNRQSEARHNARSFIDSNGIKQLKIPSASSEYDERIVPFYPYEPVSEEWCNIDSKLSKGISWLTTAYKVYNICSTLCHSLVTLRGHPPYLFDSEHFVKLMTYPESYNQDPVLSQFCCLLSKKVMMMPVVDKCGHRFDFLNIIKHIKATGQCPVRNQRLLEEDLTFDVKAFKAIQQRISVKEPAVPYFKLIFKS